MPLQSLLGHYKTLLPWNLARIKCFTSMIFGLIISGSVQQHKMALGFQGEVKQNSICHRIRSFLKDFSIDYIACAKALLQLMSIDEAFDIAIDRTNWKFGKLDINLLVLAVVVNNEFSFPILWKALPKQGNSNTQERIDLIERFISCFKSSKIRSIIGDREFIGKDWIEYLIEHEIPFYIRIKENRLVEWGDKKRKIGRFFKHLQRHEKRHLELGINGKSLYVAGTKSKNGELVIVMSNQDKGLKILQIYKRRWTIELMFRHCKSNGFNFEDTHMVEVTRIEKLMAVISAALVICFMVGKNEEYKYPTQYKRTVNAPAFSTFRRGFDYLRKIMITARDKAEKMIVELFADPPSRIFTYDK